MGAIPRCIVEFDSLNALDLDDYRTLSSAQGTLGLVTLSNDVFLCVITSASRAASVRPDETVQRIHSVEFYCLTRSDYDQFLQDEVNKYPGYGQGSDEYETSLATEHGDQAVEHPCLELKKLLSGGNFYYSVDFDLTRRLQDRSGRNSAFDVDNLDDGLWWNSYMIGPLLQFRSRLAGNDRQELDQSRLLTLVIRGFVESLTIPASASPYRTPRTSGLPSSLTLISRLSSRRAGTRFNARGIDDDGNVANFVETETIFWSPTGVCFSYSQIRGSVPVFWEQATTFLPGQQKIDITRSPEATQPAFDKHFERLEVSYGAVHVINLLSESKPGEAELTRLYRYHINHSPLRAGQEKGDHDLLRSTEFDFHAETKGSGYQAADIIGQIVRDSAEGFAYYMTEDVVEDASTATSEKRIMRTAEVLQQEGVFRTNCLDCLDRTNLVQTMISRMALESFLRQGKERGQNDFWMRHSSLWADNGDALSKIYAGTGALKSSFTRHGKMSLAGAFADARKSATRIYMNNFVDKERQNTMDLLLGRLVGQTPVHLYDPINDYVQAELTKRAVEYSSQRQISILVGTFNLNGKSHGAAEDLSSWLCPKMSEEMQEPEIVAVGFQEIVELSPQQIMSTDPARRQTWEDAVKRTLNENARRHGSDSYVLLRSGQLVGAALMVFVKASVLPDIKNVEGSVKKTGMSGIAGNKGAVAIRMDFSNTRLCFVTAHLAAGFGNYEERNRDYQTINHGLRFQKNRSIEDHDTIIWLGDFNYRIGLGNEKARKFIERGDLGSLYENDQLNLQMIAGLAFPFYSEARITFMPTYKYDNGTDQYDTSEKARIPAWCDRVLRKGTNLRQIDYNTAPLRFSDHRPVYATFQCIISVVDETAKARLSRKLYEHRRSDVGNVTANAKGDDTDDEDLMGYESIDPALPPASSDRRKWWLDNGLPARSKLAQTSPAVMPNPNRPSNPFTPTDEPDWVKVPRPQPQPSAQPLPPAQKNRNDSLSSRGARQLPPPFNPADFAGNTPINPNFTRDRGDLQRPAVPTRRTSVASQASTQSSNISRKPAPTVPKKPPLLSSPSNTPNPQFSGLRSPQISTSPEVSGPPQPPRPNGQSAGLNRPSSQSISQKTQTPPPPVPEPRGSRKLQRKVSEKLPPLPPRRPDANGQGLMDEEEEDNSIMSGWEPLQPR